MSVSALAALAGVAANGYNIYSQSQSNLANAANASSINNRNLEAQRAQNLLNRQYYLEDREYNSPSALKQRLKDAGINPNLIASNLAGLSNPVMAGISISPSSAMSNSIAPHIDPLTLSSIRLNEAQADKTEEEASQIAFQNSPEMRQYALQFADLSNQEKSSIIRNTLALAKSSELDNQMREWLQADELHYKSSKMDAELYALWAKNDDSFLNVLDKYGEEVAAFYASPDSLAVSDMADAYSRSDRVLAKIAYDIQRETLKALEGENEQLKYQLENKEVNWWFDKIIQVISAVSGFLPKRTISRSKSYSQVEMYR